MNRTKSALVVVGVCGLVAMSGCASNSASVIAATSTNVGVEVGQQAANAGPSATLGYKRAELAIVPTNRSRDASAGTPGSGAMESANVIMELNYGGASGGTGTGGIYQRLAVGSIAVAQGGAAALFAKDNNGNLSAEAASAMKNVASVPAMDKDAVSSLAPVAVAYSTAKAAPDKTAFEKYNKAATLIDRKQKFKDFEAVLTDPTVTKEEVAKLRELLKLSGLTIQN